MKKKYRWFAPARCPSCKEHIVWGHGYVLRYFQGFVKGLWMKRWRCPACYSVHTARPLEYPPGFQYREETIYKSIFRKLDNRTYIPDIPYQTQQYWLKAITFQSLRFNNFTTLNTFFTDAVDSGEYKVTFRLNLNTILCRGDPPHLIFAMKTR